MRVCGVYFVFVILLSACKNGVSNLDIDLIEMTAYAIYRMRQARQSLDQEGLLIQQGEKLVKNPAANIEKDYQKIFWQGCVQLGLSPVSRAKLSK